MSNQDQNFFNVFMVVIGALIALTVFLIFLAREIGSVTQLEWVKEEPDYTAEVIERIKPVGYAVVPGQEPEADAAAATVAAATPAAPAAAKLTGEQVYNAACFACHAAGVGGAPKLGDAAVWKPRLAEGKSTLYQHALEGFQGKTGFMPPKGGRVDLSDGEIKEAVDFMLAKSS